LKFLFGWRIQLLCDLIWSIQFDLINMDGGGGGGGCRWMQMDVYRCVQVCIDVLVEIARTLPSRSATDRPISHLDVWDCMV
jgi:hypothetical protein